MIHQGDSNRGAALAEDGLGPGECTACAGLTREAYPEMPAWPGPGKRGPAAMNLISAGCSIGDNVTVNKKLGTTS